MEDFDVVLDNKVTEDGVFDSENGVIYAGLINFSDYPSLLVISKKDTIISCEVYDNTDGIQCSDILNIPIGYYEKMTLSEAKENSHGYIMIEYGKNKIFYTVYDDFFTRAYDINYTSKTDILRIDGKKCISYSSKRDVYNFLNGLKRERINRYKFLNTVNTISDTEKDKILSLVRACADIMDFDINDFDYNTLMKYILCTNQNFKILTDTDPRYTDGGDDISIVSGEYIDFILRSVFDLESEHPAVNSLLSRGFYFDNGYYYYKNIFNTFYATDILSLEGVYNLGDGVLFTVFTDIYRQGNTAFPEYSYAVIRKTDNGTYKLLKLGMGRNLPSERELMEFSPANETFSHVWNSRKMHAENDSIMLVILLLICISTGAITLICGGVLIVREFIEK